MRAATPFSSARLHERGFNMVEIAIALAVIAFALVAIIGILPSGMQVQKETREKTVINEEARYFLDAIKSGSSNLVDLPDFVESITNWTGFYSDFASAAEIIGLLSAPPATNQARATNRAIVRALTGSAMDRGSSGRELAFRYQLTVEIEPATNTIHPERLLDPEQRLTVESSLWDLRLRFNWPVLANGNVGGEQAVYRGLVTAQLVNYPTGGVYYYFRP